MFFRLSSWALAPILFGAVLGPVVLGFLLGRFLRHRSDHLREPFGLLQSALLGVVGLILGRSAAA